MNKKDKELKEEAKYWESIEMKYVLDYTTKKITNIPYF